MEDKYKLTEESIVLLGRTLYRIEALKDFGNVIKGDKGGYVQSDENLSQEGNCWIYDNAQVCGDALVYDNAQVCGSATVFGYAKVYGNAQVYGDAYVFGKAQVSGYAKVYSNTEVFGNAKVFCDATVCCKARVYGNAQVFDDAIVSDNAKVYDDAFVYDNAKVYGNVIVCGNATISGNAEIKNRSDYIVFKNCWSSGRYFTWTRNNNMWRVGCFYGTGEELIKKAYKDSEISGREYERVVNYVETILQDSKGIGD